MFSEGFIVQPDPQPTHQGCYVSEPLHQRTIVTPRDKQKSGGPFRKKKLLANHCLNKATLIQLFRQRKGIRHLTIIGLFTVDQSTSIIKQPKCLWALGTASRHAPGAPASSRTGRQRGGWGTPHASGAGPSCAGSPGTASPPAAALRSSPRAAGVFPGMSGLCPPRAKAFRTKGG